MLHKPILFNSVSLTNIINTTNTSHHLLPTYANKYWYLSHSSSVDGHSYHNQLKQTFMKKFIESRGHGHRLHSVDVDDSPPENSQRKQLIWSHID